MRRVLIAEPVFHVHSLDQFQAAVVSDGFADAHFVFLTGGITDCDRGRVEAFVASHPRVELRELAPPPRPLVMRIDCWRAYAQGVLEIEAILREESFDFFAYLMLDNALPCFAAPGAARRLPAHFKAGVRGPLMRDNGLRPPEMPTWKERLRAVGDRWILSAAIRSGAIRKLTFYDDRCAALAKARYGAVCGEGIDPIAVPQEMTDPAAARNRLDLPPDAWIALMFGVVNERKGTVATLLQLATSSIDLSQLTVLVAGPAEPADRTALAGAIDQTRGKFQVIWRDGFVPEEQISDYFAAADAVLCLYRRFNASSGVLLNAACQGKPALVSREGVMDDAVTRYQFGESADPDDATTVADAVFRLMHSSQEARAAYSRGARAYASSKDMRRFLSQFI